MDMKEGTLIQIEAALKTVGTCEKGGSIKGNWNGHQLENE
jgi:hypothetical protein